jgi:hypothetical protein
MKWYKHLFIYLGCIAFTEVILACFFLIEQLNGNNIWDMFLWMQFAIPIVAFIIPFLWIEALISIDEQRRLEEQWHKRVNKMLEKYEKEE